MNASSYLKDYRYVRKISASKTVEQLEEALSTARNEGSLNDAIFSLYLKRLISIGASK